MQIMHLLVHIVTHQIHTHVKKHIQQIYTYFMNNSVKQNHKAIYALQFRSHSQSTSFSSSLLRCGPNPACAKAILRVPYAAVLCIAKHSLALQYADTVLFAKPLRFTIRSTRCLNTVLASSPHLPKLSKISGLNSHSLVAFTSTGQSSS